MALVLEVVGADLVAQADAAAFLDQVDQHAAALAGDPCERGVELRAAVAAQAAHDLAGEARRVDAGQHARAGDVAEHHRDVLLVREPDRARPGAAGIARAVDDHAELPVRRWGAGRRNTS